MLSESSGLQIIADGARSTEEIRDQMTKGTLRRMPRGWFYDRTAIRWIIGYMHLLTLTLVLGLITTVI